MTGTHGKRTIAILTGGGDVPGLNPAIRAITIRAVRDGHRVIGVRRGWAGLVDYVPDAKADNSENMLELSESIVNRAGRTGGASGGVPGSGPARRCDAARRAPAVSERVPGPAAAMSRGRRDRGTGGP